MYINKFREILVELEKLERVVENDSSVPGVDYDLVAVAYRNVERFIVNCEKRENEAHILNLANKVDQLKTAIKVNNKLGLTQASAACAAELLISAADLEFAKNRYKK